MLIETLQVRDTPDIPIENEFTQLRNGHTESILDSAESRIEGCPGRSGNLLEEVATKRIANAAHRSVRFPDKLGHQVEVTHLSQELVHLTELSICVDLF